MTETLLMALTILWQGMLGILVVMGLLSVIVAGLSKLDILIKKLKDKKIKILKN